MKTIALFSILFLVVILGCRSKTDQEEVAGHTDSLSSVVEKSSGINDEDVVSKVKTYMKTSLKDDLEKGFVDSLSRHCIAQQIDLNHDGNSEVFVGLSGPYFCGSGGCTLLLLSDKGELITRFTVSETPVRILKSSTDGWNDLLIQSQAEHHVLKYDGKTYPSNPSIQPEKGLVFEDILGSVLDQQGAIGIAF
ncbi:hypothetical protein [Pedobacter duraquae]|uniref:Lipoprotein n=1 Tax=Pedobacter duraquae TaxID=425511 RepID=A0A4R6ICJ2_9SPHI|nr:hypothetical protein [Pedobacter duraquae]TDO19980.1 hypothetical protein CLV32_3736 [Pedobacter duraquae]